jgi:hypothetical protein
MPREPGLKREQVENVEAAGVPEGNFAPVLRRLAKVQVLA